MSSSGESITDLRELGASAESQAETDARTSEERMHDRLDNALGILDYLNSKHFYGAAPIRTADGLLIDLHHRELRYSTQNMYWNKWEGHDEHTVSYHVVPMERICSNKLDDVGNQPYSRFLDQVEAFALHEKARWDAVQPEGALVAGETWREARNRLEEWFVTPSNFPDLDGAVKWVQENVHGTISMYAEAMPKLPDFPLVHKQTAVQSTYISHSIVAVDVNGNYLTEDDSPLIVGHIAFYKVSSGWRPYVTNTEDPITMFERIDPRVLTLRCVPIAEVEDIQKYYPKPEPAVAPVSSTPAPEQIASVLEDAQRPFVMEDEMVPAPDKDRLKLKKLLHEAETKAHERRVVLAAELSEQRHHAPDLTSGESAEEITAYGTRVVANFDARTPDGDLFADVVEWPRDRVVRLLLTEDAEGEQYVEVGAPMFDADFEDAELGLPGKTYSVKVVDNAVKDAQLLVQTSKIAKLTARLSP